ncbi:ferredoxin [Pseudoroseicyclus sp. H15]
MSRLAAIAGAAAPLGLEVAGHCAAEPNDGLGEARSIVLLSPAEPGFWPLFQTSPEAQDGLPDAMDRWSTRIVTALAVEMGATPLFPFGGPPWHPFIGWALRTGRAWASPVTLLVHERAGLFFSVRGALALSEPLEPASPATRPCNDCAAPCLPACPPRALTEEGYDVPACHGWLDRKAGAMCMDGGCLVRRACPVGADRRAEAQSAYHMKAFHP